MVTVAKLLFFIEEKKIKKRTHPLRYLYWEPTLRCNLECLHCSNLCTIVSNNNSQELSTDEIKQELYDISKHYDTSKITFIVTGGEPLMRHDLVKIGHYAYSLGYTWGITTNGILLTNKNIEALKKASMKTIAVSLDGLKEHHDTLRDSVGSHALAIKGIKNLLAHGFSNVLDILCCVSTINISHIKPFIDELVKLGVKRVRFSPIYAQGRASDHSTLMLSNKELYTLLSSIKKYRFLMKSMIDIALSDDGYYGVEFECHVRNNLHYCGAGIEWGAILYDGSVSGSTNVSREYIEGNIRKDSFVKIWENNFDRYRTGREKTFDPYCEGCDEWVLCEGGGFHFLSPERDPNELCGYYKIKEVINE